jgi:hypothetical protein
MKSKFSWRVFISFGLTWSMLVIIISGIVLYISPAGRYANWVDWKITGFTKEEWASIHAVFSFAFVVLSVFHLFTVNWKAFWSYIRSKTRAGINKKRELTISLALAILFFIGIAYPFPPFKYVTDLGEFMALSWEKNEKEAPVPHAELLTISQLAEQLKYPSADDLARKFKNHNIAYENTDLQTLQEIALKNGKTPEEVFRLVSEKTGAERPGAGMGRKTIENLAEESGKSVDDVIRILRDNNIKVEKGQTIRQIGDNNNIAPKDIFDLLKK